LFSYCECCWFGKCSSSCLEHCFSKNVIVHPLLLVVCLCDSKNTYGIASLKCYYSSRKKWVEKNHSQTLMGLQVWNVIIQVDKNGLKKITHKLMHGKYHFVLWPTWVEKKTTYVSLANVQYNLFSSSIIVPRKVRAGCNDQFN
jgi:hypothetical protein